MNRRQFLICSSASLAVVPGAKAEPRTLDLSALSAGDQVAPLSELAGSQVQVEGYALRHAGAGGPFFVLAGNPDLACPHCRAAAGGTDSLLVFPRDGRTSVDGVWQGTLDIGGRIDPATGFFSRVRLMDAEPIRF